MKGLTFPVATTVFLLAVVVGLGGGGVWTVPVMLVAGVVAMWTAPGERAAGRPGYPAERRNRGDRL